MLKNKRITDWHLEVDYLRTREYYSNHNIDEDCQCSSCKNYRVNCQDFADELKEFFEILGVNPSKEGEFMEFGLSHEGDIIYMGFYHIVGRIIEGPDYVDDKWEQVNLLKIAQYEFGFSSREIRCIPTDFPTPVIQLEFKTTLPWIIEEPRE